MFPAQQRLTTLRLLIEMLREHARRGQVCRPRGAQSDREGAAEQGVPSGKKVVSDE
jgi:hypothetical protein